SGGNDSSVPRHVTDQLAPAPLTSPPPVATETTRPTQPTANASRTQTQITAGSGRVIARVNGRPIPLSQIEQPLLEGYGLNILLNTVQLDLAKQEALRANVTVSADDIKTEREHTLGKMFQDAEKADYDALFNQFLEQQHISKAEFNLVL